MQGDKSGWAAYDVSTDEVNEKTQVVRKGLEITQYTGGKGDRYYKVIGGDVDENERLPSVTTVNGVIGKPFLTPWASKLSAELMAATAKAEIENRYKSVSGDFRSPEKATIKTAVMSLAVEYGRQGYGVEALRRLSPIFSEVDIGDLEYAVDRGVMGRWDKFKGAMDGMVEFAKGASGRVASEAAEKGERVHKFIEDVLESRSRVPLSRIKAPRDDREVRIAILGFLDWYENEFPKMGASIKRLECMVYHGSGFAGTIDAVVEFEKGEVGLIDWKTSNRFYPEHASQVAAYAAAYEHTYKEHVREAHVVRFAKDRVKWEMREADLHDGGEMFGINLRAFKSERNRGRAWSSFQPKKHMKMKRMKQAAKEV